MFLSLLKAQYYRNQPIRERVNLALILGTLGMTKADIG